MAFIQVAPLLFATQSHITPYFPSMYDHHKSRCRVTTSIDSYSIPCVRNRVARAFVGSLALLDCSL